MELPAAKLPSNMGLNIQTPDTIPERYMREQDQRKNTRDTSHL